MAKKEYGLVVAGNPLLDVLAHTDDGFIARQTAAHGMVKGAMNLVSAERVRELYSLMPPATEMSGGSGANSLSMFVALGGKGAFIGKTADDAFGRIIRHHMRAQGIAFDTPVYEGELESGCCYVLVTKDAEDPDKTERTMCTYLGASQELGPSDIDAELIGKGHILLLEGYLFNRDKPKQAFKKAAQAAHDSGTKAAFTLSDFKLVEEHRADFRDLVKDVDILIGNKKEIMALTLKDSFEEAAAELAGTCEKLVLTKGKDGALIVHEGVSYEIPAVPPEKIVDVTGAGDAFAGAFLYGLLAGMTPYEAGVLAARAASLTIGHVGARSNEIDVRGILLNGREQCPSPNMI